MKTLTRWLLLAGALLLVAHLYPGVVVKSFTSALIAAHNHPSGVAEASESDRLLTQDMITATRSLGLKLLDHVIVTAETTFSFADSGLLDELELLCLVPGDSRRQSRLSRGTR